ncbi:hypothetical protein LCGC14_0802250 [marine sediment metagenome]|uniref:SWIM-type domain-containing protein n=1 Tax=marine sediment metagenome TaxID=412755 RepID=A0A0F9S998_9ZZZZ|nr:hypothetical protein [bacterium]
MKENDSPMISYEMILEMTNSIYFQRGEEYQSWGMVEKGWIIDNGIKAKVAGNYKPYYLVQITLSDTMKLRGSCTCPVGFSCKHSVAACLQYLYKPKTFKLIQSSEDSIIETRQKENGTQIEIPEEYALKPTSLNDWISSLLLESLKQKFIELWNHFSPNVFKDLLEPDYPFKFWTSKFEEIEEFEGSTKEEHYISYSQSWFTPLELLNFLNDSDLVIPILYNWTQSYIDLGSYIKKELNSIGISKTLIDFDVEFYFSGVVEEEYYRDRWDYEEEYDVNPESLADDYFLQYKIAFEEMGRFFGFLLHEKLPDLANNLADFGFKWLIGLNLKEYRDYGLNELYKIQQQFSEQIESIQVTKLQGQARIDYLLNMYLKFKSEDLKKTIVTELTQLSNKKDFNKKLKEIWLQLIENYKIEMTVDNFLFLYELSSKFSKSNVKVYNLIKNTLFNLKKQIKYPSGFIKAIFTHFGKRSTENMEWLYSLILKGGINNEKSAENKYNKNKTFLFSYCFEKFLKYYLPKGDTRKVLELCNNVLSGNPKCFQYNHYTMIRNYCKNDSEFEKQFSSFLTKEFLPRLTKQRQYDVTIKIYLDLLDYSKAISLVSSHFNIDRAWNLIKKINAEIMSKKSSRALKMINKQDFLILKKIFNRYSNDSMKLRAKNRPDYSISQGVQLMLFFFEHFKNQPEGDLWFTGFCKRYKRYTNLRSSLRKLGIEMV